MMKNNHHINEAKINDVCKCNDEKIKGKKYVIIFIKKSIKIHLFRPKNLLTPKNEAEK